MSGRVLLWLSSADSPCGPEILEHTCWHLIPLGGSKEPPLQPPVLAEPAVGLIELGFASPAIPPQAEAWLDCYRRIPWVALLQQHPKPGSPEARFIAGHCHDFHTLPIDTVRLETTLGHLLGMAALEPECPDEQAMSTRLQGSSPALVYACATLRRFARSSEPVLITGESGAGKDCAAHYLHAHSACRRGPFVVVHCGAMPDQLVQSELFGHEKGAFTGAMNRRIGRIEAADGGSLLLDGISEFSPQQQIALLRFLQEGMVEPLGGGAPRRVRVRIIATTRQPLEDLVAAGQFRADLYYRLAVLQVRVPPLRERLADLPELSRSILARLPAHLQGQVRPLSDRALQQLYLHDWPGNVRELENRLRRAVVLGTHSRIEPEELDLVPPSTTSFRFQSMTLKAWRDSAEREAVSRSLELTRHNVSAAARQLQISRLSLYRLMDKYGIKPAKQSLLNSGR